MKKYLPLLFVVTLSLAACQSYEPYPRPYAYPRIDLPKATTYQTFQTQSCPFTFAYPSTAKISRDNDDSCWVDINFPEYDLTWHITYRDTRETNKDKATYFEDYRRLVYKHTQKARDIQARPISYPAGSGTWFDLYGNVGTPSQIFMHDSTEQQIVMMSFYFQTALKNDSLQPVIEYMKGEVDKMLGTFAWE
ncbi:MAG: hypothetical protein AAFV07_09060 [Bacteroidota bacterium]